MAVVRVERIYGCLPKELTPMLVTDCHPELYANPLLGIDDHRKFQILLGMMQWMVTIGKSELYQAVSYLNRFGACPREGRLNLPVRWFGYVKTTIYKQIVIDSRPMEFNRTAPNFQKLIPDFKKDYPNAIEEMDPYFSSVFSPLLQTIFLVYADHSHNIKTRQSITGLIGYVGSTPEIWVSKG